MDGHSGIENREVNRGSSGNFLLVLSYLKESTGRGHFVIHATPSTFYLHGIQPIQFLQLIGFIPFQGECQFHRERCFYRHFAEIEYDKTGFESTFQTMNIHSAFETFANKGINKLYELRRQENDVLREIRASAGELALFSAPPKIKLQPSDVPAWVGSIKFKRLKELEVQRDAMNKEIEDVEEFLPLVYADGDALESAVIKSLGLMGLKAEPTESGFTTDILAETKDGSKRFSIEVTGTVEAIKKESKKLTQLVDFERIKEHGEKTILVANTFKNLSISERKGKESFTKQVVDFLSGFQILMMTGWDLYQAVGDILEGKRPANHFVERFYADTGIYDFTK